MKHRITKVETKFSESPDARNKSFSSMAEANSFLGALNRGVRRGNGYYKTDFIITWDDGTQYKGRYDIGCDAVNLSAHMRQFCLAYSGRAVPLGVKREEWEAHLARNYDPRVMAWYGMILDNYQIEETME